MIESFRFPVGQGHSGTRLDLFLAAALEGGVERPVSRREIRKIISLGGVQIDGHRVKIQSRILQRGQQVTVALSLDSPAKPTSTQELDGGQILFFDPYLVAVDKPSGWPTQATRSNDVDHLFAATRRWLIRTQRGSQDEPYLALHHRLDRGTSGVVLLSKSRKANRGLARSFAGGGVRKTYLALVDDSEGRFPDASWTVSDTLAEDISRGRRVVFSVDTADGRPAQTKFRLLRRGDGLALIEALPKTGRTHQVRVHLSAAGYPVLGDRLYGPQDLPRGAPRVRLMLHASSLELDHQVNGENLHIESPLPEDFQDILDLRFRDADTDDVVV